MDKKKKMSFPTWALITVNKPTALIHTGFEVWYLLPPVRYVVSSDVADKLEEYTETRSLLQDSSAKVVPLNGNANLANAKILVARHLDRGIGDILFMTGVFRYISHISGNTAKIFMHGLVDKTLPLHSNPDLYASSPMMGPLEYNRFPLYNFHWLVGATTEFDAEEDQLNVYDALYRSIHVDPSHVAADYKRPYAVLNENDLRAFDAFAYFVFNERHFDIRRTGFFVVAPLATSTLRVAPYSMWVELINQLSQMLPVVVIGQTYDRMPVADMSVGDFRNHIAGKPSVIDMIDRFPIRSSMAVISKAVSVVCLDSGPLYLAQAVRTPAISVWGTHDPGVRIGYDTPYMELAVWKQQSCRCCPCYSFDGFPVDQCPLGSAQQICEPLRVVTALDILDKVEIVLRKAPRSVSPQPART